MSLRFFEGPAGSGKTTCLVNELASVLEGSPLAEQERVLALTKMHGSRRRMQDRGSTIPGLGRRFECITMDSFAWRVLRRWRSLGRLRFGEDPRTEEYDEVCRRAAALLATRDVGAWIARAFPIVIVDELQDCKDGQLKIVQALVEVSTCIVAADEFQDLDEAGENAASAWASEVGECASLTVIHRTNSEGLLAAAGALRTATDVPPSGGGFTLLGAPNPNVGASYVSRNLTWWSACNDIVILTPVRPGKSAFVRKVVDRVREKPIGNPPVGPHRIPWEDSQEEEEGRLLARFDLPDDPFVEVKAADIALPHGSGPSLALSAWLDRQRRLTGRTAFTVAEIREQVRLIHQRSRSYRRPRSLGVRVMTIHQAKNREFHSVIVLWPYQVTGSPERLRRLLYNGITRAKSRALVIVQDPTRLHAPPFVADVPGAGT